jgi:SAM-dependent methyltransferase
MSAPRYFAAHAGDEERLRIAGLETLYDPFTRRRLQAAGLAAGQRCLEVGAGAGSVARMMAERTETRVVAVDMDPRFLDPQDPRYEIRKLDVTAPGALSDELFDVIHCRLLLMHMPDPVAVLRMLQGHLAPGGFLLAEEPNMRTWGAVDPEAPGAGLLDRVIQQALAATENAGVWRNALGPRLQTIFEQLGLQTVASDGACWVAPDEQPEVMALMTRSLQLIATHGLAAGVLTEAEVQGALELMVGRSLRQTTPTIFGAVGRRSS